MFRYQSRCGLKRITAKTLTLKFILEVVDKWKCKNLTSAVISEELFGHYGKSRHERNNIEIDLREVMPGLSKRCIFPGHKLGFEICKIYRTNECEKKSQPLLFVCFSPKAGFTTGYSHVGVGIKDRTQRKLKLESLNFNRFFKIYLIYF